MICASNTSQTLKPSGLAAAAVLLALAAPASAQSLDSLEGKFAFNWVSNIERQTCVRIGGALLKEFKSPAYRCEMKPFSNTSTGASARKCTRAKGGREYLIFDTRRACEEERKTQASNE